MSLSGVVMQGAGVDDTDDWDLDDFEDDPEMRNIRERRAAELQRAARMKQKFADLGHGDLDTVEEKDFLTTVTKSPAAVAHFYHNDFRRCELLDQHLRVLAKKHFSTKFIRINAQEAPWIVTKLQVKVLPTLVCFLSGNVVDKLVGFDDIGGSDNFPTRSLERWLAKAGMVELPDEPVSVAPKRSIIGAVITKKAGDSDESDNDD